MDGLLSRKQFKAIIDTGSPVSLFPKEDVQQIVGKTKVVVRDMIKDELYGGYNKRRLKMLGVL